MDLDQLSDECRKKVSTFDSTFQSKTWREDVTLKVEGKKLHVSKVVLALVSPVFSEMFDTYAKTNQEIELPRKSFEDVRVFLLCVYPNILQPVSEQNVKQVLPLAHEFQVSELKKRCETFLLENLSEKTRVQEVADKMKLAIRCDVQRVKQRCIEILSSIERGQFRYNQLDDMKDVDVEVKCEVLKRINNNLWSKLGTTQRELTRLKKAYKVQ